MQKTIQVSECTGRKDSMCEWWEKSIRSPVGIRKAALDRKAQASGRGLGVQLELGYRAERSGRLCWVRRD